MSNLEIKGRILELISKVKNKELLLNIYEFLSEEILKDRPLADLSEELSNEQQKELDIAIKESYEEKNHISQEDVFQKYKKWRFLNF